MSISKQVYTIETGENVKPGLVFTLFVRVRLSQDMAGPNHSWVKYIRNETHMKHVEYKMIQHVQRQNGLRGCWILIQKNVSPVDAELCISQGSLLSIFLEHNHVCNVSNVSNVGNATITQECVRIMWTDCTFSVNVLNPVLGAKTLGFLHWNTLHWTRYKIDKINKITAKGKNKEQRLSSFAVLKSSDANSWVSKNQENESIL